MEQDKVTRDTKYGNASGLPYASRSAGIPQSREEHALRPRQKGGITGSPLWKGAENSEGGPQEVSHRTEPQQRHPTADSPGWH